MDDASSRHSSTSSQNDVFAIDETVVPSQTHKVASTTEITFDGLLDPPLLVHEDLKEGCGGQLWPAGMLLSRYMLIYHKTDLVGKVIIELGAGGGLVGLAVARGCDTTVPLVLTDQLPMLALMQKNIALNGLTSKVTAAIYDWGTPVPDDVSQALKLNDLQQYPDIILAADCVYFEPAFPLLLQTLSDVVGFETICYFCFKKRRKADWRFIKQMQKKFDVELVVYTGREKDHQEGIYLYEVKRKPRHK